VSLVEEVTLFGWDRLRHGGLLLDPPRLRAIAASQPTQSLWPHLEKELRRQVAQVQDGTVKAGDFAPFVLGEICGFTACIGTWQRGSGVGAEWARAGIAGEAIKPRHLWRGDFGAVLPVFIDTESRLGIGRGTKAASQTLQWLRAGKERLALLTNGRQWRLVFAGLDFDAWCQWDVDLWFEEGAIGPQVTALRTLLQPALWTATDKDGTAALLQAILDSRKGQAELSAVLGERVREAVEVLVQAHGDVLKRDCADVDPSDIYRAAVRIVMRLVVVLFAESREKLLPRDNALYHSAYGLTGLREELDKVAARAGSRLKRSSSAWPRVLALFRLIFDGSHHPDLPVPEYGGELFQTGDPKSPEGLVRALAVFETACFDHDLLLPDSDVHQMLELLTRTKVRIRQGRASTWAPVPVDFSDLSSEYIGILYEGLLDFELKTAPSGDPVIFLAVGNQPALHLSRLEGMDDKALASLLEKMKDTSGPEVDEDADGESQGEDNQGADDDIEDEDEDAAAPGDDGVTDGEGARDGDERFITRTRAEEWARRAVVVGKLATKPRGALTGQKRQEWDETVAKKAKQVVARVILPGEWYLVRWGGTRKGSGTFYTRPGLAVPTVHRTLRPLAYVAPGGADGTPDLDAPVTQWLPRTPEEILALKVCDPACGSGTFPVAALRFLTDALYSSLHHHGRISETGDRAIVRLLDRGAASEAEDLLGSERLACRPSDETFEPRLKAVLRRHVVERCIYGVDLDPLAVELCRLALWIETMERDLPFSFLDHKIKCGNSLVGSWFDTFQHYPVMAWKNREGGDKGHTNGVHFEKEARTKAIKAFVKNILTPDLQTFLRGRTLFNEDLQERALQVHASLFAVVSRLHDLPVHAAVARARAYRDEVQGSVEYQTLKRAMDLWCACWFWPATAISDAPLPTAFAAPSKDTLATAERVSRRKRFFHWELEFPDVFNLTRSGFDAILGNPPWENLQPNPEEFFSNRDPLFRAYGRLAKNSALRAMFSVDSHLESEWLDYSSDFVSLAHWVGDSANPFGDPDHNEGSGPFTLPHSLRESWRRAQSRTQRLSREQHPFRYQIGRIFSYKLFLEASHALLRDGGRLGEIVPSGLYSDSWSQPLRELFLNRCRWEWLFGFENRDKIFDIHRSSKFNPIIVEKSGETRSIRAAFMKRRLEDWESAETATIRYPRENIDRFSPRSKVIPEIDSLRDLELLDTIYEHSVLLGDVGPDGWRIKFRLEFMMNTDAELFPPRPNWEAKGYRPDEYNRWIDGNWKPIEELWRELGIDPAAVVPVDPDCERRIAASDVARTQWRRRCAQSPYDALPIPRCDIPAGIILSRDADAWVRQSEMENVALPLYEGRMIGQFDFSEKGWQSGKGRGAKWPDIHWSSKTIRPQYCMASEDYVSAADRQGKSKVVRGTKVAFMDVTSSTNQRTMVAAVIPDMPSGNSAAVLGSVSPWTLSGILNSFPYDFVARRRCGGLHLNWFVVDESPLPKFPMVPRDLERIALRLGGSHVTSAADWTTRRSVFQNSVRAYWAVCDAERARLIAIANAIAFVLLNCTHAEARAVLAGCDSVAPAEGTDSKGFWRVDKEKDPELRQTILTLVALADLEGKIRAAGDDRKRGIQAFLNQNDGDGWMLPETLTLAEYGLGRDGRAKRPQPVASRLGPRFYDWQLAQTAEESWRECEIHAKNLQATFLPPSESSSADGSLREPADTSGTPRGTHRRKDDKGLLALYEQEDEPA
jgi:hypothetical protein